MSFFEDKTSMLAYYSVQAAEFRMRHEAIFSEIKHYSWLISLLLGSPVALLLGRDRALVTVLLPYFLPIPFGGVAFSVLAFFIIRREYHMYNESEARLLFLERSLGVTSNPKFLDGRLAKAMDDDFSVAAYCMRERALGTVLPWKARIRMMFLMEFWLFGLVGLAEVSIAVRFLYS
jgi:hypothetical protein